MTNYFRHYQLRILTSCNCYSISTNEDNKLYVIKDGLSFIRTDDSTHFATKGRIKLNACLLYTFSWHCAGDCAWCPWCLCTALLTTAHYDARLAAMLPISVSALGQGRMLRVTLVTTIHWLLVMVSANAAAGYCYDPSWLQSCHWLARCDRTLGSLTTTEQQSGDPAASANFSFIRVP